MGSPPEVTSVLPPVSLRLVRASSQGWAATRQDIYSHIGLFSPCCPPERRALRAGAFVLYTWYPQSPEQYRA